MNNKIDKTVILLILVLFAFSNNLLDIIWNIGKSLLYLIIFLFSINQINPDFAQNIKTIIYDFLNIGSNNFIKDTAATVASSTMNFINSSLPPSIVNFNNRSLMNTNNTNNRNLMNTNNTNNRNLMQTNM
jgi:hypothetical protein